MSDEGTLISDPIRRPDEPRHFMVLEELPHPVTATRDGQALARSTEAIRCQEAGRDLYDPVVYFPRDAVAMERLRSSEKTTTCPLKGKTEYFHLVLEDGRTIANAAWRPTHGEFRTWLGPVTRGSQDDAHHTAVGGPGRDLSS